MRARPTQRARLLPGALAPLFLAYGLLAVMLLAWTMPGFQNADEVSHLIRAESVSRLQVFGPRGPGGEPGGVIQSVIPQAAAPFAPLRTDPLLTVSRDMLERATPIRWSSPPGPAQFANTAIYPPFLYAPQAAAIAIGKALDLSVLRTLNLARMLAGLAGVALGAVAIARAGPGGPYLFALLALPMSLALLASPSQDALILPVAALAAAELTAARRTGWQSDASLLTMCVALALVGMARPPYLALALLPLAAPGRGIAARMACAGLVAAAVLGWSAAAVTVSGVARLPGTDVALQVQHVLDRPSLSLASDTLARWGRFYVFSFIGQLGWLDVELPRPYYAVAALNLVVAYAVTIGSPRGWAAPLAIGAATTGCILGVFAIQYATWTPVGAPVIEGVQGRYFLVPAMLAVALAPAAGRQDRLPTRLTLVAIALFPALSIAVAIRALLWRYYLG